MMSGNKRSQPNEGNQDEQKQPAHTDLDPKPLLKRAKLHDFRQETVDKDTTTPDVPTTSSSGGSTNKELTGATEQEPKNFSPTASRALDLLRQAHDLPSLYAAFQNLQETAGLDDYGDIWPAGSEKDLVDQALLAVPYLMYRQVQLGLEESGKVRSQKNSLTNFQVMGPRSCSETFDHKGLLRAFPFLSRSEGWQVLPILKSVGEHARSRLDELRNSL